MYGLDMITRVRTTMYNITSSKVKCYELPRGMLIISQVDSLSGEAFVLRSVIAVPRYNNKWG